jgi:ABC-type transporter Mla subunit MlaD
MEKVMNSELRNRLNSLKRAKNDFMKSTKRTADQLGKQRDRLAVKAKRVNDRVRKTSEQLKIKLKQLAATSKSNAKKTHEKYTAQAENLKKATRAAKAEAAIIRNELSIVKKDLADAGHHLSHAMHIDKSVERMAKMLGRKKKATK